jgi:hypothetical protein
MAINPIIKENLEEDKGKTFSINPYSDFKGNEDEFARRMNAITDLKAYWEAASKNKGDIGAKNDLLGVLSNYLPRAQLAVVQNNYDALLYAAYVNYEEGLKGMAMFVENNRSEVLNELSEKQLFDLFLRTGLYNTKRKDDDNFRGIRNKYLEIQEAHQRGQDLGAVVEEELAELVNKAPTAINLFYGMYYDSCKPYLIQTAVEKVGNSLKGLFRDNKGKLNKQAIISYLERNYKAIEDLMEYSLEKGKKEQAFKLWDKNLKRDYFLIAEMLYPSKKEEQEWRDDSTKKIIKFIAREELGAAI